jgi:hypothetical protein
LDDSLEGGKFTVSGKIHFLVNGTAILDKNPFEVYAMNQSLINKLMPQESSIMVLDGTLGEDFYMCPINSIFSLAFVIFPNVEKNNDKGDGAPDKRGMKYRLCIGRVIMKIE